MPRIAVVMPVKDSADTVESAIGSVIQQTSKDFALIVVDDASTDATPDIVQRLAEQDKRVIYAPATGSGCYPARNQGIGMVDSEFVATMDGDDICLPIRLEFQLEAMACNPALVMVGSQIVWFGRRQGIPAIALSSQQCRAAMSLFNPLVHPTTFIRRSALAQIGEYDVTFPVAADFDLMRRLSYVGEIRNIETPLLLYRLHDKQISSQKQQLQRAVALQVLRNHHARLTKKTKVSNAELLLRMAASTPALPVALQRQALRALKGAFLAINEEGRGGKPSQPPAFGPRTAP